MMPSLTALLLALVVASGLLARERRRTRAQAFRLRRMRGRYLFERLQASDELASVEDQNEELRLRLLLSTLRAGDSTCAAPDEPLMRAANVRREYRS